MAGVKEGREEEGLRDIEQLILREYTYLRWF